MMWKAGMGENVGFILSLVGSGHSSEGIARGSGGWVGEMLV